MLRASQIDATKLVYENLNSPYDWNYYPLALLGCEVVVYNDGDTRNSQVVDAFYLGPAKDHYQCNIYYIPETRAHRISGSTELFLQHYQLPYMTPHQHFHALTEDELTKHTAQANGTCKKRCLLKCLVTQINTLLSPTPISEEQKVNKVCQRKAHEAEQRVIDKSPIITLPCITNAPPPPIMLMRNPMAKQALKTTPWLHKQITHQK